MEINYLDTELMEKMCHRLAVAVFNKEEEPIPPFRDHTSHLLESAINLPRATFGGKELYPALVDKAAVLYYHLNKNHPFKNGNKRIATVSLLVFLFINNHWFMVPEDELVSKTLFVANSDPKEREKIINELKEWIRSNSIKLEDLRNQLSHD